MRTCEERANARQEHKMEIRRRRYRAHRFRYWVLNLCRGSRSLHQRPSAAYGIYGSLRVLIETLHRDIGYNKNHTELSLILFNFS